MTDAALGRRAGLLIPLFSCPSSTSWGIGDIGDLVPITSWLAAAGQRVLQILPIIGHTATPILSRTQGDDARLARGYFLAAEVLMTIMAPLFLGLFVIAPSPGAAAARRQMGRVHRHLQVICLNTLFYSYYFFSGVLIIAKGRGLLGFGWRVGLLLATVAPAYLGARYANALGLAAGVAVVTVLAIVPYYLFVLRNLLGPASPGSCARSGCRSPWGDHGVRRPRSLLPCRTGTSWPRWRSRSPPARCSTPRSPLFRPAIAREIMLVVPFARIFELLGSTLRVETEPDRLIELRRLAAANG
jgi:hypothetical protein